MRSKFKMSIKMPIKKILQNVKINFFVVFLSWFCLATSCEKDNCIIPEVELVESMAFGCKVDGKNWKPATLGIFDAINNPPAFARYSSVQDQFVIEVDRRVKTDCDSIDQRITIYINEPVLGDNIIRYESNLFGDFNTNCVYHLDTSSSRIINLSSFDKVSKTTIGTFNFTTISDTCMDTVKITEGRFDITW